MEMEMQTFTVEEMLELYKNKMLAVNSEYQRGAVWSRTQQKKLIDSVMRGYPIPMIYLHYIHRTVKGFQREDFEIIDGQQRINALHDFADGAFKLLDPILDEHEAKFPNFIKQQPCPWGRKDFSGLSEELRQQFLNTSLAVVKVTTDVENEARDLFIRLQAGLPLNSQETRDAWPGNFTDFVLKIGGKPKIARYPGHSFFPRVMGMKPDTDRGKTRMLAAQMAMLFLSRRDNNGSIAVDINSRAIDDFYYTHIDFDSNSEDATRLIAILDKLEQLFAGAKRPKLRGHEGIHLLLLTDELWDGYTREWEDRLVAAHERFSSELVRAKRTNDQLQPDEFWTQYGQWTRVNSDRGENIRRRHLFYLEKMIEYLSPLTPKDPTRLFGPLEREYIYYRDKKLCGVCQGTVDWNDAEIHHVRPHARGGATVVENAMLVHRACHSRAPTAE